MLALSLVEEQDGVVKKDEVIGSNVEAWRCLIVLVDPNEACALQQ